MSIYYACGLTCTRYWGIIRSTCLWPNSLLLKELDVSVQTNKHTTNLNPFSSEMYILQTVLYISYGTSCSYKNLLQNQNLIKLNYALPLEDTSGIMTQTQLEINITLK